MSGYSGTPLPRKLGIAEGGTFAIVAGPDDTDTLLGELPAGARRVADPAAADVVLVFTVAREELARHIEALGRAIFPDRMLWVAWPKNAGAEPMPPKLPQPRITRETAIPLRPSARFSTGRSYVAA